MLEFLLSVAANILYFDISKYLHSNNASIWQVPHNKKLDKFINITDVLGIGPAINNLNASVAYIDGKIACAYRLCLFLGERLTINRHSL